MHAPSAAADGRGAPWAAPVVRRSRPPSAVAGCARDCSRPPARSSSATASSTPGSPTSRPPPASRTAASTRTSGPRPRSSARSSPRTMDELYASLGGGGRTPPPPPARRRRRRRRRPHRPANRRFVAMYRQNTALMALFEQVTTFDPEVRALRQAARERMVGRVRHSIEQLQADGLVDAGPRRRVQRARARRHGQRARALLAGARRRVRRGAPGPAMTDLWASSLGLPAEEILAGRDGGPVAAGPG